MERREYMIGNSVGNANVPVTIMFFFSKGRKTCAVAYGS
jgi:hypothetical protein